MLLRRIHDAGQNRFVRPATTEIASSGGMWQGKSSPAALIVNGYLYAGWVNGSTGNVELLVWPLGGSPTSIDLHAALGGVDGSPDLHDSPSLLHHSNDHLWVAYSAHDGAHPLLRRSVNTLTADPGLSGGFNTEESIGSSGSYTYCSLIQNASGWVYLLCRNEVSGTGKLAWFYWRSDTGDWNTPPSNILEVGASGQKSPYFRAWGDGDSKIHVVATDTDRTDAHPASLYHCYMGFTGTNCDGVYASDGTEIAAYASFPIDVTDGTLIGEDVTVGSCDPEDLVVDVDGQPVVLFSTWNGFDLTHWRQRWNGSSWEFTEVGISGGLNNGNRYQVGACFAGGDPDRVIMAVLIAGTFELARKVWNGSAWTGGALTHHSSVDNVTPQGIPNGRASGYEAVYASGTYTDDQTYDVANRVVRKP